MADLSLAHRLARLIESEGPQPVSVVMQMALGDTAAGYYTTRESIGAAGDFITAPEISQMFGEILGAFLLQSWSDIGEPADWSLIELGPGRGTLMADILRVIGLRPAAAAGLNLHLVETSPRLRAVQSKTLTSRVKRPIVWHSGLASVIPGPMLLVANEFFDALPIRQVLRRDGRWYERCVRLDAPVGADAPRFAFALVPLTDDPAPDTPDGTLIEISPAARAMAEEIGYRLSRTPGRALIVDYGYDGPGPGDTLQAVRGHASCPPLEHLGDADLTAHVDLGALARAAGRAGAAAYGPIAQSELLDRLGIAARADALKASAPQEGTAIDAALRRLVSPDEMGTLFQALCLASPHIPPPPGFDNDRVHSP